MKRATAFLRSFRARLIIVSITFIIPAILLPTVVVSHLYTNTMKRQNETATLESFSAAADQIENLLKRAHRAVVSIINYPEVDNLLFGSFTNEIAYVQAKRDMTSAINSAFVSYDMLNAVFFFTGDEGMYGSSIPWTAFYENERHPFTQTEVYQNALASNASVSWLGGYRLNDFIPQVPRESSNDLIMICGLKKLVYSFSNKPNSDNIMVLFSITESSLHECLSYISAADSDIYLLNSQGEMLSGDAGFELGKVPAYYGELDWQDKYGSATIVQEGVPYQLIYYRMGITDWTLVKIVPLSLYRSESRRLSVISLVISALTLVVMAVLYTIWASKFTRPFNHVKQAMERVHDGDLSVRMNEDYRVNEFRLIGTQFNQMLDSINSLVARNQAVEREKLDMELRILQSQINPHFIYNTIASIRWMATLCGASNVSDMLITFAELLRPVFSEWKMEWTLAEELDYIAHYMTLMQLRYGTQVAFSEDLPPETRPLMVPRFVLQPILENCCEHGIVSGKTTHVALTGTLDGGALTLTVCDDGRGMSCEQLEEIRRMLREPSADVQGAVRAHVGIVNVQRRVRLSCGADYGLTIDSADGQDTRVHIRLPGRTTPQAT